MAISQRQSRAAVALLFLLVLWVWWKYLRMTLF